MVDTNSKKVSPRGDLEGARRAYKYRTADPFLYGVLKEFAKRNRNNQTGAESYLWQYLRTNNWGFKFQRQHIIYDYIADFVCLEANLVIEVDGGYHSQYEQMVKDIQRTEKMNKLGFAVIRFSNDSIFENIEEIMDSIYNMCNKNKTIKKKSPLGEI